MPAPSDLVTLVTLDGGLTVNWAVVQRLLDLESRGATFELKPDGGFRVLPSTVLNADDTAFLKAHRDEARRVLEYEPPGVM
jgi:hypothetical protein